MFNRFLPALVFLVTALVGVGMTSLIYQSEQKSERVWFEALADETAAKVQNRIEQHIGLLLSTRALFVAENGYVPRDRFATFVENLGIEGRYEGIQGIGFATLVPTGEEEAVSAELEANYNLDRAVWPETAQTIRTPIVLLEPADERNKKALGFDMFQQADRRDAMMRALETSTIQASAPVELVQEITSEKQAGFLVYVPFKSPLANSGLAGTPASGFHGFIYAAFRAGDLHLAALENKQNPSVIVETRDVEQGADEMLFKSTNYEEYAPHSRFEAVREFEIAGRAWQMTIMETPAFSGERSYVGSLLLGALSLLFAGALAVSTRAQIKRVEAANSLAFYMEKTSSEKDLMLQEMKHRIKNHIARIQAMSRHTARTSDDLAEYSEKFSARLQAMANAQDMLTRSNWQGADLKQLVLRELEQVFGDNFREASVSGPEIELNEKQAQALSLTIHELATNAVKYAGFNEGGANIAITWKKQGKGWKRECELKWKENSPSGIEPPESTGFGTKLIDANITGELGGTIERSFEKSGLQIVMTFPV